jgi:Xaa-Pro aminopeptidase
MLEQFDERELRAALEQVGVDGWLLFDFHGCNPIAQRIVGAGSGLGFTRRLFVWLPKAGRPTALVHTLDAHLVPTLDGEVVRYTTWQELHRSLERLVGGRRVAMETSEDDAVPYLDRVPAGVIQLLSRLGATVVSSGELVSGFAAQWTEQERAAHRAAAEALANIARTTLTEIVTLASPVTETEVQRQVLEAIDRAGLTTDTAPIVAFGEHSANAHYEPNAADDVTLGPNMVVLLDLWAHPPGVAAWADQTWMGYAGGAVPSRAAEVWEVVRDARDRVIARLQETHAGGEQLTGAALDDAARGVIAERGFAEHFVHRTGHSIDLELHGSGPHLDNFETHDTRRLVPGVAFSVEPGVYLPGAFGMRTEVNVLLSAGGPEITPRATQTELVRAP